MRTAVIGLGRMGVRHLEAARKLDMDICGLADQSSQNLDAARQNYPVAAEACFTDALQMIETVRPEALVVATTAQAHAQLTIAAAKAGVAYILCEKPMASSIDQCRQMVEACQQSGSRLAINHQMRFMPQYTEVKALIEGEMLGPLSSILVAGSNFGLAMNASHYFEMFRYVTGRTIDNVHAWLDEERVPNPRGPQFEDRSGRLLGKAESGPTIFIDFAAGSGYGLQVVYICRNGQIVVDELNGTMQISARQAEFRSMPTTRYGLPADLETRTIPPADTVAPTMAVWQAMIADEPYPDGAAGLHALTCTVAAHVSHQRGGVAVRLDATDLPSGTIFPWA